MRYSGFRVITEGLFGNTGWTPAWRDPAPKAEYDAIVIGGGGHGLSTAYYLAKNHGLTNVAVLEKGLLGQGNIGRNTTIVRANYFLPGNSEFYSHSLKLWEGLEADLNYNVMHSQRGLINLFHSDGQRDAFVRRDDLGHALHAREETQITSRLEFDLARDLCARFVERPVKRLASTNENHEAVAQALGVAHRVGREEYGRAGIRQAADCDFKFVLVDRIEARERLVEDDEFGFVRNRCRELNLLRHAFRQRFNATILDVAQTQFVEKLAGPATGASTPHAFELCEVRDRVERGHAFVEAALLRQIADAALNGASGRAPEDGDFTLGWWGDAEDHAQR